MNQNIPTLTEILATELNPDDVKAGAKQIADALAPVSKWVHMIEDRFYGLASLLGFAGVICFAVWLRFQIQFPEFYYLGFLFLILCFLAAMVPQLLWRRLFDRDIAGWRPRVLSSPALTPLRNFMARCADGTIKVETHEGERVDQNFFGADIDSR